jgi:hypothetical protein
MWFPFFIFLQGTTFVLQKTLDPQQRLLQAISAKGDVEKVSSSYTPLFKIRVLQNNSESVKGESSGHCLMIFLSPSSGDRMISCSFFAPDKLLKIVQEIEELVRLNPITNTTDFSAFAGKWRQLWSSQVM